MLEYEVHTGAHGVGNNRWRGDAVGKSGGVRQRARGGDAHTNLRSISQACFLSVGRGERRIGFCAALFYAAATSGIHIRAANSRSSLPTAWRYMAVVARSACPSHLCTRGRGTPERMAWMPNP